MALTTEQQINRMARNINTLLNKIEKQERDLETIKEAIYADKQLLDTRIKKTEAAKILGVSTYTVGRMIKKGIITTGCKLPGDGVTRMSRKEVESLRFDKY